MNIINKIRRIIDRKKALNELYDDIQNLDEVLLDKRIEIFREIATPRFVKIGLINWDGKYLWYSDFNDEGIKHVIEYNVHKGFAGSFTFGNCYLSIPTISGKRLINHRTDKSTKIIYFKRLEAYEKSIKENQATNPDIISTINEEKFRNTLEKVLSNNIYKLEKWFSENRTINQNIERLHNDSEYAPLGIGQRTISFEYILAFLYKEKNNKEQSKFWIKKHFEKSLNSEIEIEIIKKRLEV